MIGSTINIFCTNLYLQNCAILFSSRWT